MSDVYEALAGFEKRDIAAVSGIPMGKGVMMMLLHRSLVFIADKTRTYLKTLMR